ncbi:OmpA family protein [Roseivirga pacifica]|uniref:OmpA family protein n=1 Tax=Roseivirga pacifica TaxID=1267423 RepID=UPI002094FD71|nr:OmpA family protein [Roseivirga pacifica]MCO6360497.1 OmpA family protein [Roseivirga pacifica]MCO6368386.1 OmpA family protein [Roseivirga pacifica]MCO6372528.1 OmpA family protein [Roseivirga pacifica]MCO6376586.1 OmpA family protein [Roseivirga pacifica]MCO6378134.1 OmpA family protein [Roseivirga pacifica]
MKRFTIQLIILITFSISALAQEFNYNYSEPINFKEISSADYEEAVPLMSPNQKRMYFTRTNHKLGQRSNKLLHEIWYADFDENGNLEVVKAPKPLNVGLNSAVIGLNMDGTKLFLFGTYNKLFEDQKGVSYSLLQGDEWTKPARIKVEHLEISGGFYGLYMHPDEDVLVISKKTIGSEDLFVSVKDARGNWSAPQNLGETINTEDFEISPFLTLDKKHLFFSRGNDKTGTDIFYASRLDNSWTKWTEPERLPAPINSASFDAYFSMMPDSTVVFSSNRSGSSDIYFSTLTKELIQAEPVLPEPVMIEVEELAPVPEPEPQPINFETETSGYVFFGFNQTALSAGYKNTLDAVADTLLSNTELMLEIGGHADYIDTEPFNEQLSIKRAMNVTEYLLAKGVDKERLFPVGYGELFPVSNNNTEKGRMLNRRVELKFLTVSGAPK